MCGGPGCEANSSYQFALILYGAVLLAVLAAVARFRGSLPLRYLHRYVATTGDASSAAEGTVSWWLASRTSSVAPIMH